MNEQRELQEWMVLTQEEVDELDEETWDHYSGRGCLCHAHEPGECCCGSWDDVDYDYNDEY